MSTSHILVFLSLTLAVPIVTQAEVYKWVDEQGRVRYGDKPPKDQQSEPVKTHVNIMERSGDKTVKLVRNQPANRFTGDGQPRRVLLENIVIDQPGKDVSYGSEIGHLYRGLGCGEATGVIRYTYAKSNPALSRMTKRFKDQFSSFGWATADADTRVFSGQTRESAEISLAAIVKDMRVYSCQTTHDSRVVHAKSYLKIEWQLFDNLKRKVIYSTITEGSDDQGQASSYEESVYDSLGNAFGNAAINLLAQNNFVGYLKQQEGSEGIQIANAGMQAKLVLKLNHGATKSGFTNQFDALKVGTVTVRTPAGHGSGFFITTEGHVLTNAHVVGKSERVIVVLYDGSEILANPVRLNEEYDVALLKIEPGFSIKAVNISQSPSRVGDSIYIIGTPLDEKLSHTVTKGIVSAVRNVEKKNLIQTDAAVNPGNSGGPAFNEQGQVIGIAAAGLFSASGGSLNINYLIPINEAFEALTITPQP